MKRDFALSTYSSLLKALIENGYQCISFLDFLNDDDLANKVVILRHDVDKKPENSLAMAIIESEFNVRATYYFRTVKCSFDPQIIKKIADLGHEIGYHYEDLTMCHGDTDAALKMFEENLASLKVLYPIKTICMHGSPMSCWDNRSVWEDYDYRDFGIIGEPYFDINFDEIFYMTDTGRSWNRTDVSVRDKVMSRFDLKFDSTFDIIDKIQNGEFPTKAMINTHPQRWNDALIAWTTELVAQNIKNVIKHLLIRRALRTKHNRGSHASKS